MSDKLSQEKRINRVYSTLAGIPDPETGIARRGTGIAEPGDLFFFITHHTCQHGDDHIGSKTLRQIINLRTLPWRRQLQGFSRNDFDQWHVGIYFMGRKRKRHKRMNLWLFHSHGPDSDPHSGVHIQHISPLYLNGKALEAKPRIEILTFENITQEERKRIVEYANSKLGMPFDSQVVRHAYLTYAFGVPNVLHNRNKFSCQQLVISAYAAAGIFFQHPYTSFPVFNIGRFLGHPIGHPKDKVDPRYPYLMDHHIYRDPRFFLKAALYRDPKSGEIALQTDNLTKYSWNEDLREKYLPEAEYRKPVTRKESRDRVQA